MAEHTGITFSADEILQLLFELNDPSMQDLVTLEVTTIDAGSHLESSGGAIAESSTEAPGPALESFIKQMHVVSKEEENKSESESCPICFDELFEKNDGVVVKAMPCRHRYHAICIEKWLNNTVTCPLCRYKLSQEEAEKQEEEDAWGGSS